MSSQPLDLLHIVRQRREVRIQRELDACREAEKTPRNAVFDAQTALDGDQGIRLNFVARWGVQGGGASNAAEQIEARACLARLNFIVDGRKVALNLTEMVLAEAVKVTAGAAARLTAARIAKEKNEHGAKRQRQILQAQQLALEEASLEDETDLQVMMNFMRDRR